MKDKLRGFLGFLGLVEDEYGEYGPSNAPRPFSESPEEIEPEWASAPPPPARTFPTRPASASGPRSLSSTTTSPPARRNTSISVLDGVNGTSRVRPIANPNAPRGATSQYLERDVAVVVPSTYDDSRRITDLLRSNRAVVLTTLEVDQGLARRLVDFTAGTAYALNAKVEILVRGVYLVSPQGVRVDNDTKERLRAANYRGFDQA